MRIVFEGADLVGKSTMAQEVAKRLNRPYRGRIVRVGPKQVLQAQRDDFKANPDSVLDRCYWLSDTIYEPIVAHAPSAIQSQEILKSLQNDDDTLYIIVMSNEATLGKRMQERGDDLQSLDNIIEANRMYKKFVDVRPMKNMIVFNNDSGTIAENVAKLLPQIIKITGDIVKTTKTIKVTKQEDKGCKSCVLPQENI